MISVTLVKPSSTSIIKVNSTITCSSYWEQCANRLLVEVEHELMSYYDFKQQVLNDLIQGKKRLAFKSACN